MPSNSLSSVAGPRYHSVVYGNCGRRSSRFPPPSHQPITNRKFNYTSNRISGFLSEENRKEILALIEQAKNQMPYLLDLDPDEQRALLRLGDKTESFVRRARIMANRSPDILPRAFDLDEMNADVDLYFELKGIQWALT